MTLQRALLAALIVCMASGCGPGTDDAASEASEAAPPAPAVEEGPPPELMAQLDSGSAAFRVDDFQGALRHYVRATEVAPASAAAWFGVYMAHAALGNEAEAAQALAEAQALDPGAVGAHPELSRPPR